MIEADVGAVQQTVPDQRTGGSSEYLMRVKSLVLIAEIVRPRPLRFLPDQVDRAAERLSAVKNRARPLQHFHVLDIVELRVEAVPFQPHSVHQKHIALMESAYRVVLVYP